LTIKLGNAPRAALILSFRRNLFEHWDCSPELKKIPAEWHELMIFDFQIR
jgi:hypothetical protein